MHGTATDSAPGSAPEAEKPAAPDDAAEAPPGPPVAVLPPLLMPARIMSVMARRLARTGRTVYRYRYNSYGVDIPDNAALLAEWLRETGEEELDVVAFSLGGVLLRWAAAHHEIPRLRRVVLLGAPSQGAYMADWLDRRLGPGFPVVWGRCARQLRRGNRGLCERAGQFDPETRVGVIAGGTGKGRGFNPLIPSDNDLTVGVPETVLPGMSDFALVRSHHSGLVFLRRPWELTLRFLETGRFRERRGGH